MSPASEGLSRTYTYDRHSLNNKKTTTAQYGGSSSGPSRPGHRPRQPHLRRLFLGCETRRGRAPTAAPLRSLDTPGTRRRAAARYLQTPPGCGRQVLPGSTRPRTPAGRDPQPQFTQPPASRPPAPSDLRTAAVAAPDSSASFPRPQPAARPPPRRSSPDSHPHRALVRGTPHAGGWRRQGPWASAPQS